MAPQISLSFSSHLPRLLRPLHVWIRVLYLQPEGMTDELIAAIRDTPEVLPYKISRFSIVTSAY